MKWWRWTVPAAIVVVAVVPAMLLWSRLPDVVATHWDGGGKPNGHGSRSVGIGGPATIAVVLAVVLAYELHRSRPRFLALLLLGGFGATAASIATTTALANRDVAAWPDGDLPMLALLATMASTFVGGGAAVLVTRDRWAMPRRPAAAPAASAAPAGPRAGRRAAWSGTARGGWALAFSLVICGANLVLVLVGAPWVVGVVGVLAAVATYGLIGAVRVTAGAHGLTARSPLGWPAVTIPLADIERVEVTTLEPMAWGGWGYRGSLRVAGQAAWIVRRGEGVVLHLADDHRFAVTVDDAEAAAETLSDQIPMR